ncbi:cytochrome c biogenesis protein CcdA [bacterium]|nr:cytochrome c biogenesis protein CcdA [bacterium]
MQDIAVMFNSSHSVLFLYLVSFIGGLIASVSPCSLAMLPLIVGYVGGFSDEKPSATFVQMLSFVIGSAVVFSVIGIFCALTGKVFVSFAGGYFGLIMASIIMIMGLKLVGFLDFEMPVIIKEMPKNNGTNMCLYPFLLGGAVALAGTPCSTPILAAIMAFASLSANLVQSVVMLFLFSVGQGVILVFAGVLTSKIKNKSGFYNFSDKLLRFSGVILVLTSVYIFYKIFYPLLVK